MNQSCYVYAHLLLPLFSLPNLSPSVFNRSIASFLSRISISPTSYPSSSIFPEASLQFQRLLPKGYSCFCLESSIPPSGDTRKRIIDDDDGDIAGNILEEREARPCFFFLYIFAFPQIKNRILKKSRQLLPHLWIILFSFFLFSGGGFLPFLLARRIDLEKERERESAKFLSHPLISLSNMIAETESAQSNLERFLDRTTPVVQSQLLPKSEIRNLNKLWNPWEKDHVEFFRLADLWKRYDEWSAYGAGVPIVLDTGETLIQYYVPYLSAIQIFISHNARRDDVEWVGETRGGSFSDSFSEDSENEKVSTRWDGCSSEEESGSILRFNDRLGSLYFQLFDRSTPYSRVPLKDKICGLAERYPGLMNLRSVDLSPASWMAVAWYPIYHIPMGRTIKDLSTCFLTYHTLSSSFQDRDDDDGDDGDELAKRKEAEGEGEEEEEEGVRLSPFGLATYKMKGDVWATGGDQERLFSLVSVADSWLKQLRVQHHDFNYFLGFRSNGGCS